MLRKHADKLVNAWPDKICPILQDMHVKIKRFGLLINGFQQDICPAGKFVGAKLSMWGEFPNAFPIRPSLGKLDLKLNENGNVKASISGGSPVHFEPREIEMVDVFPEQEVRGTLADYVGYCLRRS
jgi:hypothetical protein